MSYSLSLYNPDRQNDDGFVASFVARHGLLYTLLRRLRSEEPGHSVLIGSRGMGKTTLLRRLAIAINREPDLRTRYVPLSFREEQYNVLSLGDFWRNCGESLAEWAEAAGLADLAHRLDAELATPAWAGDEQSAEQFNAELRSLQRRAVLLVDNIDLILDALPDDRNWVLRRYLQARQGPIVIGAATQPLKQSAEREAAFYEFFEPVYLEPLDVVQTEACMRALARTRGKDGSHVIAVLDKQPERLKTLHTLTGGNPRILTLIYQLLEAGQSDAAMADLEILLDQVTPYYKARIEEYQTAQQRAVIDAIALHWDPITTGGLSDITNIVTTTLSPLLSRLRKDGLIENVETSGSYAGHQLVERFFNIWYLMRHGTRRTKQKMRWLVAFLTSFYSLHELTDLARRADDRGARKSWRPDYAFAFDEALQQLSPGRVETNQLRGSVLEITDLRGLESASLKAGKADDGKRFTEAAGLVQQAFELLRAADYRHCLAVADEILVRFGDAQEPGLREQVSRTLVYKAVVLGVIGDSAAALAVCDDVLARFGDAQEPGLREQVAGALVYKAVMLGGMGDSAAALAVCDDVLARFGDAQEPGLRGQVAGALINKAVMLGQMGDSAAALAAYDDGLVRFGNAQEPRLRELLARALVNKAVTLGNMGNSAAAVAVCDGVLARFSDAQEPGLREQVANALVNKAVALGEMGDSTAAVAAYDDVVARFGDAQEPGLHEQVVARALVYKAVTLGDMGNSAAAVAVCDDVLARFGDAQEPGLREQVARALAYKAATLGQMGDSAAALAVCDDVLARFGDAREPGLREPVARALVYKAIALGKMGDSAAAVAALERLLALPNYDSTPPLKSLRAQARVRFANILLDLQEDFSRAETLYREAASVEPLVANANLAWLYLLADRVPDAHNLRRSLGDLPAYGLALLDAAIKLAEDNFGSATDALSSALGSDIDSGRWDFSDDLDRLLRLADRKGYGERLIAWFETTGFADRLAPIFVAFKAYVRNEKLLLDVNPEVRQPAQVIYDRLDAPRRHRLALAPKREQSRRKREPRRKAK